MRNIVCKCRILFAWWYENV